MAILGSTDLGDGLLFLSVDHDPTSVSTDAPAGSLIWSSATSRLYRKLDNGDTTNVDIQPSATTAPSTDDAIARYDGTESKLQNSGVTIDDSDNVAGPQTIALKVTGGLGAHVEGKVGYDPIEKALAVFNDEAEVTQQLGQEGYIRVYNNSGGTITNGTVVYDSGVEGVEFRPTIAAARADVVGTSSVLGIATHDIENNSFGYVTEWGLVNDLDTSSFSPGDRVYLSPTVAGGLTATKPAEDEFVIEIGLVIRSHATLGRILVHQSDFGKLTDFPLIARIGTVWDTGLAISEDAPPSLFVAYTAGTYFVQGASKAISPGGTFDLTTFFASLAANERAWVGVYVDADEVLEGVVGTPVTGNNKAEFPALPSPAVCLAYVMIRKSGGGAPQNIVDADILDCREEPAQQGVNTDEQVKVSADDTTAAYLEEKLVGGTFVNVSTLNGGADEDVEVAAGGTLADLNSAVSDATLIDTNDSRLSDARTPTGAAGGELGGTYPNPTVNDGADATAIHDDTSGEIAAITQKVTDIQGADILLIEDSEATNAKKRITVSQLPFTDGDADAIHDNVAGEIALVAEKTTPVNADLLLIEDSAAANAKKRIQIGNLPAAGGGEANTASNVGSGADIFKQKTGVDLEFRGINAASAKISAAVNLDNIDLDVPDATTTAKGAVELATDGENAANVVVQGNDSRLSDARTPTGAAGGDLASTYPNPRVAKAAEAFQLTGVLQPSVLNATENDYAPPLNGIQTSFKLTPAGGGTTITGIAGGTTGRLLLLRNMSGSASITLAAEDAGSAAANRFSKAHIIRAGEMVLLQYDATLLRWVPILTSQDYLAIHDNRAGEIAAVTEKVTPVNADLLLIEDSADSNNKKRVQIGNLPGGGGTPGDQATVQGRRTTTYSLTTSFVDIGLDATDVENDAAVLNHDLVTDNDRILVGETGPYLVGYHGDFDTPPSGSSQDVEMRVRVNDTTVINGSLARATAHNNLGNIIDELSNCFVVNLTAGDFISLQAQRTAKAGSGAFNLLAGVTLYAVRLTGEKGDTGTPGAGSTVIVKDDNVNVPNTPHSELDFGAGLIATDAGSGRALIDARFGSQYQVGESLATQTETGATYVQKFRYTTSSLPAGTYFVQMSCEVNTSNAARLGNLRLQEDDVDLQEWLEISKQDGFSTKLYHNSRVLGAGTHTYDFEIRDDGSGPGATISIRNMRIVLWRVA